MPNPDAPRRRNAAATRAAILASAHAAFAQSGYDGAGVRDIAAGAGVTAMLVNRYFGSKEQLFAEVIAAAMATPTLLTAATLRSPSLGHDIAAGLVAITGHGQTPLDGFQMMLRSASSPRAAEIASEQIHAHYQADLACALPGARAEQRAALILAVVAGFQVMRQMIALPALAHGDPAHLVAVLGPMLQALVEPPAAG